MLIYDRPKVDRRAFNDAYWPYLKYNTRTQIYFGGSSSGKSYFLAQRTILDVIYNDRNYLICRNTASTIKRSVFNEIVKAIINYNAYSIFNINKTDMVITCLINSKQILFCGLDDPEKIKSITPINGVITDIWVEEATETEYTAVKQLQKRLRGMSASKKRLVLSFNPILQTHWIYNEYFGKWDDNKTVYESSDLFILKTTYLDNKFLTDDDRRALENEKDPYYYQVYTLGNWGVLGAVIYKNWGIEDLSDVKASFDKYKIGLDFGFAQDPSALIVTHYDKARKRIYVFDEVYATNLDNEELAMIIREKVDKKPVTCDSAEPKSIAELKKYGVYAIGAKKGPDSIDYGIKFLQKHEIIIDVKCQNFKNEIQQYKWKEDKTGNVLPVPIDKNNHLLDGLRYAYEDEMKESQGIYFI
jgi:phage terminase large subunit